MGPEHILVRVENDRDEGPYLNEKVTLGDLDDRVTAALLAGYPRDAEIEYGYVPNFLTGALFVKKPLVWADMSFEDLKTTAVSRNPEGKQAEAWAEIRRRVEGS